MLTLPQDLITDDISEEADLTLKEILGENQGKKRCRPTFLKTSHEILTETSFLTIDWTTLTLKPFVLELVSRLSSRLFVGTELCRNKEWLYLAQNYTLDSFNAVRALRRQPLALRRIMVWFLPEWRKVRQDIRDARRILAPVINARLASNRMADEKGVPRPRTKDTIQVSPDARAVFAPILPLPIPFIADARCTLCQWFHDAFETHATTHDIADAQLALSVVSMHTTTELLTGVLLDLAQNEEFIKELRDEIAAVLAKANEPAASPSSGTNDGAVEKEGKTTWKKTNLYQMKLLDSALKESQRLHVRDTGK